MDGRFLIFLLALALPEVGSAQTGAGRIVFTDVLPQSGITFLHQNGSSASKYYIETMGTGCAVIDYDGDGLLDVYFANGSATPQFQPKEPLHNVLYRQNKDGTFTDVTERAGVPGNGSYGMGVSVGDYNNDGHDDIFLGNFGSNQLYRNNGDGTFTDVTGQAGLTTNTWAIVGVWMDYDNDGWLDLFVVNYLDFTWEKNPHCGDVTEDSRGYCHPDHYNGVRDYLYHNNGDGTFTDVGIQAGITSPEAKGMGAVAGDINGDGFIDIYVCNDSVRNFLYVNQGNGTFTDIGLFSGAGFDEHGKPQASMGAEMVDYDGDGRFDLFSPCLDHEYNILYRNLGDETFQDVTIEVGLGGELKNYTVGFAPVFFDFDNDGWKDLFVANGHVLDNIERAKPESGIKYAQPKYLYRNTGKGTFVDVTSGSGDALSERRVSRGAAVGDLDNDGDLDVVVSGCNEGPQLFRNEGGNGRPSLQMKLIGARSNRNGIGSLIKYQLAGRTVYDQVMGGRSYGSACDYRVFVGMGQAGDIKQIEIRWSSGVVDKINSLTAGAIYTIEEGKGVTGKKGYSKY